VPAAMIAVIRADHAMQAEQDDRDDVDDHRHRVVITNGPRKKPSPRLNFRPQFAQRSWIVSGARWKQVWPPQLGNDRRGPADESGGG